ncbi:MAG: cytochrome c [Pseudomonadota bacterium]
MNRYLILLGAGVVAAATAYSLTQFTTSTDTAQPPATPEGSAMVQITLPPIEGNAAIGQQIFEAACSRCHGVNGVGNTTAGPPLIHKIYEPSHHADEAFQRAVATGVRSHHWKFGNMPPVEGLTRGDVTMIIAYIRDVQRANGIN